MKKQIVLGEGRLVPSCYTERGGKLIGAAAYGLEYRNELRDWNKESLRLMKFKWDTWKDKKGKVHRFKLWRGPKVRLIAEVLEK